MTFETSFFNSRAKISNLIFILIYDVSFKSMNFYGTTKSLYGYPNQDQDPDAGQRGILGNG